MTLLFFLALSVLAIAGALGVVLSKNPVYSALSLLLNFAIVAVMFLLSRAHFVRVAQIIVYAGAVVVLFLFVIMLIGGDLGLFAARGRGRTIAAYVAVAAGALMLLGLGYMAIAGVTASTTGNVPGNGSVQAIGEVLFTKYLLPFELASVLLLVAMIGAVVLARKPR